MGRIALIVGGVVAVAVALAWVYREPLGFMAFSMMIKPSEAFDAAAVPSPPDYSGTDHWAAHPESDDGADFVPPSLSDNQNAADVDVFFLHPTTYLNKANWNQPLDDEPANRFVDDFVLKAQASTFNGCCRVYAPRYRQATFYSFLAQDDSGDKAMEIAYEDIVTAFDYFIREFNQGRPFILAGHSQGAVHAVALLEKRILGAPEADRLVAAYPVGTYISEEDKTTRLGSLPVCQTSDQTGCYVTWNAIGPKFRPFMDTTDGVCVNPLNWSTDGTAATFMKNKGSVSISEGGRLEPRIADATCQDGMLMVSEIQSDMFDNLPFNMGTDNHHILDYSLFYVNIRENAIARTAAFFEKAER